MGSIQHPNLILAAGSCGADGTPVWERGGSAANAGAGNYTITLEANSQAAADECIVLCTPRTTAGRAISVTQTNASSKLVVIQDNANANTNTAFDWMVVSAPSS